VVDRLISVERKRRICPHRRNRSSAAIPVKVQCPEERVGFAIVMNVGRFEEILECRGWIHPAGLE